MTIMLIHEDIVYDIRIKFVSSKGNLDINAQRRTVLPL